MARDVERVTRTATEDLVGERQGTAALRAREDFEDVGQHVVPRSALLVVLILFVVLFNLVGHTYRHLRTGHAWSAKRAREEVLGLALRGVVAR